MTSSERNDIAERLITQQKVLRTVFESCEAQADMCDDVGAKRLAFAIHMVRESLIGYAKELNTFVLKFIADEPFEEDEFPLDT
jgi:hypothetical protein